MFPDGLFRDDPHKQALLAGASLKKLVSVLRNLRRNSCKGKTELVSELKGYLCSKKQRLDQLQDTLEDPCPLTDATDSQVAPSPAFAPLGLPVPAAHGADDALELAEEFVAAMKEEELPERLVPAHMAVPVDPADDDPRDEFGAAMKQIESTRLIMKRVSH